MKARYALGALTVALALTSACGTDVSKVNAERDDYRQKTTAIEQDINAKKKAKATKDEENKKLQELLAERETRYAAFVTASKNATHEQRLAEFEKIHKEVSEISEQLKAHFEPPKTEDTQAGDAKVEAKPALSETPKVEIDPDTLIRKIFEIRGVIKVQVDEDKLLSKFSSAQAEKEFARMRQERNQILADLRKKESDLRKIAKEKNLSVPEEQAEG